MKIKTAVERILNENVICVDKDYLDTCAIHKKAIVSPKWLSKKVIKRLEQTHSSKKESGK